MADDNNIEQLNDRIQTLIGTMEKFIGITATTNKEYTSYLKNQRTQNQIITSVRETFKKLNDDIGKGRTKFSDIGNTIKAIDDDMLDLKDSMAKSKLETQRNELATKYLTAQYRLAGKQFAKVTADIMISGMIKGGKNLVDGLQGTASGIQLASGMMETIVDVGSSTIQAGSKIASELGMVGAGLAKTGRGRLIGLGISGFAEGIGYLTEKSSELAKFGIQVLTKEVEKTIKAFHDVSSTGAVFANGMTELRQAANSAGLTVDQFANVLKINQLALYQTGLGMSEAAKRIGGISKELRFGAAKDLGQQLQNLGYGFDEQTEIAAMYAANLNASGKLRSQSDAEVARGAFQLAKDLRTLQAVTGEDAKKRAENARLVGLQSDIMARLSPEEGERFQAALRSLPEQAHKGFLEFVSSGGTAIVDGATNLMMQRTPEFERLIKGAYSDVYDASKSATDVANETLKQRAAVGEAVRNRIRSEGEQISMANRLLSGMGGVGQAYVELQDGLILATQTNKEQTEKQIETVDAAAKTNDAFTKLVTQAEATAQALKVSFEDRLTGPNGAITKFVKVANEMLEGLESAMRKAGFDVKETGGASTHESSILGHLAKTALAYGSVGAIGGSFFGPGGTAAGGVAGAAGGLTKGMIDIYKGQYAIGGIAEGPVSGYSATLHGTEAIVPLPDNRSIPVNLDSSSLTAAVHQQSGILAEILRAMQNNNTLTSQIVQNSY
jgi:hypothetical protein